MNNTIKIFAVFCFLFLVNGCNSIDSSWKQEFGSVLNNSYSPYGGINGTQYWSYQKNKRAQNMVMDQSSILYYTQDRFGVQALNLANTPHPAIKWTFPTNYYVISPLALDDNYNVFFVCGDDQLYQVRDGQLVWQFSTTLAGNKWVVNIPTGAILVDGGNVYVGYQDGTIYSLNYATQRINWTFQAYGSILSLTALPGNILYAVSNGNQIYAIDINNNPGTVKWQQDLYGKASWRVVPPCIPPNATSLLVASVYDQHDHIRSYDLNTGNVFWDNEAPVTCDQCPLTLTADNQRLFISTTAYGIKTLRISDGAVLWQNASFILPYAPFPLVVDAGGVLYVPGEKKIHALNVVTGYESWSLPVDPTLPANIYSQIEMIMGGKYLYVSDYTGLYAIQ